MNQRIYNYSIHLLARRDYSEFKLKTKLRSRKDNLPHEIDEVILKLKENGLLREENYRRLFIRKWMLKGESEDKIRRRGSLEKLEFQEEEFRHIEKGLGIDESESIEKLILKKIGLKEIPTEPQERFKLTGKILRFLISKGHCYEDSKKILVNILKDH